MEKYFFVGLILFRIQVAQSSCGGLMDGYHPEIILFWGKQTKGISAKCVYQSIFRDRPALGQISFDLSAIEFVTQQRLMNKPGYPDINTVFH